MSRPVGYPADVAATLAAATVAAGDGAVRYADVLGLAPAAAAVPVVAGPGRAGGRPRSGPAAPGEVLTPLYLRRPDAVEPATRKAVLP